MSAVTAWMEATTLATWVRESPSIWAYPTVLTLHTVGLGVVVGASAVVDVRLLGFGRRMALASLAPLFPILWMGLALNASTGAMLFVADATFKAAQPVFWVKLLLIALALATTTASRRRVVANMEGGTSTAVLSLVFWAGAITAGRLMAYL